MTYGPLGAGFAAFQFDSRNRLTSAGDTAYTYDPNNNRVALTENGATTRFVIDPNARLSRLLMETDDQGNPIAWYVYGMGLISRQDLTGEVRIYHYDVRGSTVALTDLSGTVTDRYYYGPYGELLEQEGDSQNRFLYNGRDGVQCDANGLYYMRARYYNPEIKRFINQDILLGEIAEGQSLNRFAYVNGNPVSYIDPFGLAKDSANENASRLLAQPIILLDFSISASFLEFLGIWQAVGVTILFDPFTDSLDEIIGIATYRAWGNIGYGFGVSPSWQVGALFQADSVRNGAGLGYIGSFNYATPKGGIAGTLSYAEEFEPWSLTLGPAVGVDSSVNVGRVKYSDPFLPNESYRKFTEKYEPPINKYWFYPLRTQ